MFLFFLSLKIDLLSSYHVMTVIVRTLPLKILFSKIDASWTWYYRNATELLLSWLLLQHLSLLEIPPFHVVEPTMFFVQNVVAVVVVFSRFKLSMSILVVVWIVYYDFKSIPIISCQISCLVLHLKRSIPLFT